MQCPSFHLAFSCIIPISILFGLACITNLSAQHLNPGDTFQVSFQKYIGAYPINLRRTIGRESLTDTILKNIPASLHSYLTYKIDCALNHTYYLKQKAGKKLSPFGQRRANIDSMYLTNQLYNHYIYAISGLRQGYKVIIFDTNQDGDLKGEKIFEFPYNREGILDAAKTPVAYTVDPLTLMDQIPGNELLLNYEIYDQDTIVPTTLLVEIQPFYVTKPNPSIDVSENWIDHQFTILTSEHIKTQVEIMDSTYEIIIHPTYMLKYYGGTIFIRNVRDPIFKVQRADWNRNLNVNGYPIKVQSNLEGTAGIIIMGNEPDFGHERKNLNNFQSQLLEIKSNRVFPLEVSQQELNVVHFLGTWCGPCKKDLPLLHALRDQYPNVPFTGIACENNIDLDQLQELAKNYDLNWRFLVDQNVLADHHNLANQLGIHFFPTYLVVNQDGKVVFRDSDVEKLNAFLKDHN